MDSAAPTQPSAPAKRITELDAVRGFALCGIHVVNVYQQVVFPSEYGELRNLGLAHWPRIINYGFYERFFPIFTLLFGIGFGMFLVSASSKTDRPRVVLARRLAALAVIGLVHQFFHLGEALLPYAVFAFLFLIPASFLSTKWQVASGVILLLVGMQTIGGYGVMPGLLVLGLGFAGLGLPGALSAHRGRWTVAAAASGAIAIAYWILVAVGVPLPALSLGLTSVPSQIAALAAAMFYACLFVLALQSPLHRLLDAMFAPMGRMALTNYLMATFLILTLAPVLGIDSMDDGLAIAGLVIGIIVVEALWSPLWLRTFRYGPFEWAWRCVTWWTKVRLRRYSAVQ